MSTKRRINLPFVNKLNLFEKGRRNVQKIKRLVESSTVYLADTHGIYNLMKEPVAWTVPKNTLIFETQTIGDYCLTNIDRPLWILSQGSFRQLFLSYFLGNTNDKDSMFISVFKNMTFYKPGDTIYTRELYLYGGREERRLHPSMGFYRFGDKGFYNVPKPGERSEAEIQRGVKTRMIETGKPITNQEFVEMNEEEYRIFIFSSCADVECGKNDCDRRLEIIERHQRNQQLQLMELGVNSGLGSSTNKNEDTEEFWREANSIKGWETRVGKRARTRKNN
jgi:hypothetical protein